MNPGEMMKAVENLEMGKGDENRSKIVFNLIWKIRNFKCDKIKMERVDFWLITQRGFSQSRKAISHLKELKILYKVALKMFLNIQPERN
jgi:hypothetical protein